MTNVIVNIYSAEGANRVTRNVDISVLDVLVAFDAFSDANDLSSNYLIVGDSVSASLLFNETSDVALKKVVDFVNRL